MAIFITNVKRGKKKYIPIIVRNMSPTLGFVFMTYVLCFFVFCPRDPEM